MATAPDRDLIQQNYLTACHEHHFPYGPYGHDHFSDSHGLRSKAKPVQKTKSISNRRGGIVVQKVVRSVVHAGGDFINTLVQGKYMLYNHVAV